MPKIDIARVPFKPVGVYPAQFKPVIAGREKQRLGNVAGLTQFGVNITRLAPGAASALRHWHREEDEFIFVLEGELLLEEDGGAVVLRPGEAAGFKAGVANGHRLVNKTAKPALYLEIGTRASREHVEYPDVDLVLERDENGRRYARRSGEPY